MKIADVIVVIPVYQEKLSSTEQVSLKQAYRILNKYPIRIMAPMKMKAFFSSTKYQVEFFDDKYFENRAAYSKHLLSPDFYRRFSSYDYILIYQLDAFVFSDRMDEFIKYKYDYIGAPWLKCTSMYRFSKNLVGNGGFSLRNVKNTIRLLETKQKIINAILASNDVGEDALFAFFAQDRNDFHYRVAPPRIAKQFALQFDFHKAYMNIEDCLPFGCHGWNKIDFYFWKPLIEKFGYTLLDTTSNITTFDLRMGNIRSYIVSRIVHRNYDMKKVAEYLQRHLHYESIDIWGLGVRGKEVIEIFNRLHIPIRRYYDSALKSYSGKNVYQIEEISLNCDDYIVIASTKYGGEMNDELLNKYNIHKSRILTYNELVMLIFRYYINVWFKGEKRSLN